ncbi:receptor-type tyrosine-protein phosphatase delta-like isoform X3 [Lethenteron reissneri]|uniref:receptor-type tyrosine-protein phosphatase delta-like isoform X3 n=1 Tax=Lethenteron reissneri TaxID=7753 RepID=UPI002AB6F912|nr:receptor-type tyrosine-protein phosphatase delta-like isoform X3 [Lethenteron reissneri]
MSCKMGLTERLSLPALLICLPFLLFILGLTDADSPPHFTRTPVDQSGVSSGVAAFVCKTAGDPRPRITWMKKGKRVSSQRFEVTEFEDGSGSVLRIQPLRTPRDEGEYECTASNGVGVATASATLTVYREDQLPMGFPVIDNGPVLRVVERTRLATMLCVVSGTPDPEITWYKDLLPVDTGYNQGRIKQLRSESFGSTPIRGALQIENSQDSDQGKYECVATNSVGTRFSAPAKLFVKGLRKVRTIPPRFTIVPTNQEVVPGGSINITCVAMGSPMPFVKWMLGTQALTPADEMPIGLNMLQLTDVRSSNNYTCVAMSSLGVIEAVVQVAVKALPRPPGTPLVTETTATSITLTWDSGNVEPVLHYVLLLKARSGHSNNHNNNNDNANNNNSNEEKEDEEEFGNSSGGGGGGGAPSMQEIGPVTTTRYTVGGLSPYSDYEVRVVAVNGVGRSALSGAARARTGERAPSTAPWGLHGRMVSPSNALLQWQEPAEPNGQIRGYRVYSAKLTAAGTRGPVVTPPLSSWMKRSVENVPLATLSGLEEGALYAVRVLAFTNVGDGPLSPEIHIIAQFGVPSQPISFKAEAESDTSMLLSWLPPRQENILKYELLYREGDTGPERRLSLDPTMNHVLEGLRENTLYSFRLAGRSLHGLGPYSPTVTARTLPTLASGTPRRVEAEAVNASAVMVRWRLPPSTSLSTSSSSSSSPPPLPHPLFRVRWWKSDSAQGRQETQSPDIIGQWESDDTSEYFLIGGLQPETSYSLTVRSLLPRGEVAESLPKTVKTKAAVPSKPHVKVTVMEGTVVLVEWEEPEVTFGPLLDYRLTYKRMDAATQASTLYLAVSESSVTLRNLHRGASYSFVMVARSVGGVSGGSLLGEEAVITVVTPEAPPSAPPLNVSVGRMGRSAAALHWEPPPLDSRNGVIVRYTVLYRALPSGGVGHREGTGAERAEGSIAGDGRGEGDYEGGGLSQRGGRGARGTISEGGRGPASGGERGGHEGGGRGSAGVGRGVPGGPGSGGPGVGGPGGDSEEGGDVVAESWDGELHVVGDTTAVVLSGLQPNRSYEARVRAHTQAGPGPLSDAVHFRTLSNEGAGGFAMNFRIKAMMPTSVLLSWEVPDSPRSNERLQIVYRGGHNMEVDAMKSHQLVVGLEADSLYSFMLNAGPNGGLLQVVSVRTVPQVHWSEPGELIGETGGDADGDMREHGLEPTLVPLPQLLGDLRVRMYLIVVVPLYNLEEQPIAWVSPNNMDFEEILDMEATSLHLTRQQRMSLRASEHLFVAAHMERLERPFVVARLEHLPPTFPIGDGHSRRLQPGLAYRVCVLALLHAPAQQASVYVSSPCSPPVLLEAQPVIGEDEGLVWVVGPVLATIIIIVIVIAILLYKSKPDRSKREAEVKGCLPAPSKDTGHSGSADPVQMRRLNHQTPGMEMHPPIPVSEFAGHVERLKANDNMLFSQEYESIDPGQQFTWDHSNLEINKHKNRYANVVAYDHSRVILHTIDGVPGSDYINANYIDGYRRHNAYIASQGPLADTVADFWRMVWEQRSSTIVMMTKLEERSRVKCDQYWPNRGSESYGLVQVTLTDTVELATYSTRSFTLTRSGCTERRDVRQFQFTAWPDHGVPEFPTPVLAFLRRVRAAWGSSADGGPLIVHCSAGVGRTGCLIVIDAALERVKHEHTVDVYGQVTCMRAQRNYMVQTEEQYAFVHTALVEAVSSGCTETPARSLHAHLQRLSQSVSHTEPRTTGLHLEFQRLQMSKLRVSTAPSGALPCNKLKNRLLTVIPPDSSRVALQAIRGTQGSDYINASYIDGYRQQRAYIATQGPLPETTEDLWRMLWEQNSTIVVMLTKLREMGREKCHQYWPAERSARYQYFVVDPMAEYKMPQYVLREFKVTDARDGQSRTVRQFQFTDWPEQGVPRSGEGFIDFIGQVHKTKEQFGQEGPITVHCSAGVGRTGVFVALSVVLERMRYEGLLDLFQTVKMMRTQRPGMVQTEDQYQFCYRAALEYLGSFDHYTV